MDCFARVNSYETRCREHRRKVIDAQLGADPARHDVANRDRDGRKSPRPWGVGDDDLRQSVGQRALKAAADRPPRAATRALSTRGSRGAAGGTSSASRAPGRGRRARCRSRRPRRAGPRCPALCPGRLHRRRHARRGQRRGRRSSRVDVAANAVALADGPDRLVDHFRRRLTAARVVPEASATAAGEADDQRQPEDLDRHRGGVSARRSRDPLAGQRPSRRSSWPAARSACGGRVTHEFLQSQVEIGTGVCATIGEARAELRELREHGRRDRARVRDADDRRLDPPLGALARAGAGRHGPLPHPRRRAPDAWPGGWRSAGCMSMPASRIRTCAST